MSLLLSLLLLLRKDEDEEGKIGQEDNCGEMEEDEQKQEESDGKVEKEGGAEDHVMARGRKKVTVAGQE